MGVEAGSGNDAWNDSGSATAIAVSRISVPDWDSHGGVLMGKQCLLRDGLVRTFRYGGAAIDVGTHKTTAVKRSPVPDSASDGGVTLGIASVMDRRVVRSSRYVRPGDFGAASGDDTVACPNHGADQSTLYRE